MWNLEGNLPAKGIIVRYTSKPEKVFIILRFIYLFFFFTFLTCWERLDEKQKPRWARVQMTQASTLIGTFFFYYNRDWTRAWQAVESNELSQHPIDQNLKEQRFEFTVRKLLEKMFVMDRISEENPIISLTAPARVRN